MGVAASTSNGGDGEQHNRNAGDTLSILGGLLDDNVPANGSSRTVVPPKTWRKPYDHFVNSDPNQTIVRNDLKDRMIASLATLSNREPNKLLDDTLLRIISNDERIAKFDPAKHCDQDQVICADAIYAIATAMRYLPQNISGSKEIADHPLKCNLKEIDLSYQPSITQRYELQGYTSNKETTNVLAPFSHVRARLPLSLGGGSAGLKVFQAVQILIARAPNFTYNVMVENGEFLPGVPTSSCQFHEEQLNGRQLSLMQQRFGEFDRLSKDSNRASKRPVKSNKKSTKGKAKVRLASKVEMGRRKDHVFFTAGLNARERLVPLVSDVKVYVPPGSIVAKVMIEVKNAFGTRLTTVSEIIDTIALCKVLNLGLHKKSYIVRLNDAESQTEKETWWDQQSRCFVFLIWIEDEQSFIPEKNDTFDAKAGELKRHLKRDLKKMYMDRRKLNGGAAGIGYGISVFEADGIESVSLTPQDHEGVVYNVPLKYLLSNLRQTKKGSNPWIKECQRHMEKRQAKVLAARAVDADVVESNHHRQDEYEGTLLEIRRAKGLGLDKEHGPIRSMHDVLHKDGSITYNANRFALQFGGLDQGFTEGGFAALIRKDASASGSGTNYSERIELDMYTENNKLPYNLSQKNTCVIISEKKAPSEDGPPSYMRAAPLCPGSNAFDQLYVRRF